MYKIVQTYTLYIFAISVLQATCGYCFYKPYTETCRICASNKQKANPTSSKHYLLECTVDWLQRIEFQVGHHPMQTSCNLLYYWTSDWQHEIVYVACSPSLSLICISASWFCTENLEARSAGTCKTMVKSSGSSTIASSRILTVYV